MNKKALLILILPTISLSSGYVKLQGELNIDKSNLEPFNKRYGFDESDGKPIDNSKKVLNDTGVELKLEHKGLEIGAKLKLDDYYIKWNRIEPNANNVNDHNFIYDSIHDFTTLNLDRKGNFIKNSNVYIKYDLPRYKNIDLKVNAGIFGIKNGLMAEPYLSLGIDGGYNYKNIKVGLDSELDYFLTTKYMELKEGVYLKADTKYIKDIKARVGINAVVKESIVPINIESYKRRKGIMFNFGLSGKYPINNNLKLDFDLSGIYIGTLGQIFQDLDYKSLNIKDKDEICVENNPTLLFYTQDTDYKELLKSLTTTKINLNYSKNNLNLKISPYIHIFRRHFYEHELGAYFGINTDINKKFFDKWVIGTRFEISKYVLHSHYDIGAHKNNFKVNLYTSYDMNITDKLIIVPKLSFEYSKNRYKLASYEESGTINYAKFNDMKLESDIELKYLLTNNFKLTALAGVGIRKHNGEGIKKHDSEDKPFQEMKTKLMTKFFKISCNMMYSW